ncbi:hypothetical protein pb186bvf_004761 [Paramecium bursaria]
MNINQKFSYDVKLSEKNRKQLNYQFFKILNAWNQFHIYLNNQFSLHIKKSLMIYLFQLMSFHNKENLIFI